MKTRCYNSQSFLKISFSDVQLLTETLLEFKRVQTDEVIFHFIDKKAISNLHEEFFSDPSPTDCISFPIDHPNDHSEGHHILGEVFVCSQVAIEYAKEHTLSPYSELSVYMIHGLLHLLGYDDLSATDKKIMREEETRCMTYLRQKNALIDENVKDECYSCFPNSFCHMLERFPC